MQFFYGVFKKQFCWLLFINVTERINYQVYVTEALQSFDEMSEELFDVRVGRRFGDAAVHNQTTRLKGRVVP